MSIRLRLTLLYTAILALTLFLFGAALYSLQARDTLESLKKELRQSGERLEAMLSFNYTHPPPDERQAAPPPERPLDSLTNERTFNQLREREIVRVLNPDGSLLTSPFGISQSALPLSSAGLVALTNQEAVWEIATYEGDEMLIYNLPGEIDGEVLFIVQVARPLTERNRTLFTLERTLIIAGLLVTLAAFGIGWILAGAALRPIHRITQTAQEIGKESDFSRRVDYHGPRDEIGELATTFNAMLSRLQEAYQRVSHALNLQRNFVADVSHELRTPLTTVRGNLDLLRHEPPPSADVQVDILSDLVSESDRLIRLVNNLLLLARADIRQSSLDPNAPPFLAARPRLPMALFPAAQEACRLAAQLDPRREIQVDLPDESILFDRDTFMQVLLILLDNAIKYTRGTIRVEGRRAASKLVLCVQDEGPGISAETLAHIFDRFYRGESSPEVPGFGLGLPIAKALVESQGGDITVESDLNNGTQVCLSLPRDLEAGETAMSH